MVVTHLPSNVLQYLVPFVPTLPLAVGVLLLRFNISQLDVSTRQSYTVAVAAPDERSAPSDVRLPGAKQVEQERQVGHEPEHVDEIDHDWPRFLRFQAQGQS